MSEAKEEKKEKCFVIMPISDQGDYPTGHFTKVYEQIIKPSVEDAGYEAYRVDENNICDAIINKIFSAIQECPMAICDLSNRNPNVLYELGLRQAYDKPVVLIQDDKTEKIFDVSGISTVFYKSTRMYEDVIKAREDIKKAILSTKKGKANTLVKVMKVNAADFSNAEVSSDDKTNIMLEGIYNEIRKLKYVEQEKNSILARTKINALYDSDNLSGSVTLIMAITCGNSEIVTKFISIISKTYGVKQISKKRVSGYTWRLGLTFINYKFYEEAISSINELASELNIEFMEDNLIF